MTNHKLTCVAIDDESSSLENLTKYINLHPNLILKSSFNSSAAALAYINSSDGIDILFVDIVMPEIGGLELAALVKNKFKKLVFTTGYTQYGYRAFDLEADAYLLKPYTFDKFTYTIRKMCFNEGEGQFLDNQDNNSFYVKENNKLVKIYFNDIVAFESKLHFLIIHTTKAKTKVYLTLTEAKKLVQQQKEFIQVHRSFIISEKHIESISGNIIKLINETHIQIGRNYKENFDYFINRKVLYTGKSFTNQ